MLIDMKLKILFIGPVYGGSLPPANYTASTLKNMGHEVEFLDFSIFKDAYFKTDHITRDNGQKSLFYLFPHPILHNGFNTKEAGIA